MSVMPITIQFLTTMKYRLLKLAWIQLWKAFPEDVSTSDGRQTATTPGQSRTTGSTHSVPYTVVVVSTELTTTAITLLLSAADCSLILP